MMKFYDKVWLLFLAGAALVVILALLATPPARAAGPWYVGPGGSDSNNCLSQATRCATINGALAKPGFVAGDTVYVAVGTYTGTSDEVVLLNRSAILSGGWNSTFTTQNGMSTIDGQWARQGLTVNGGVTAIVERFIVQNGNAVGWVSGGGIYNSGQLTLNKSTINSNIPGGILNIGTLSLSNSAVSNNKYASGITNGHSGSALSATLFVNNSTISNNTATQYTEGGGINNWSTSTAILNNSTVFGNVNLSSFKAGGITNNNGGTVTLQNSIVFGNIGEQGATPDCYGTLTSSGYNLIGNTSDCTFTPTTGDLTNIDPKLGPLEGSPAYHPLLSGSPAINAGNPAGCMGSAGLLTTDQRGAPRLGRCDIGAYEYGLTATKSVSGDYTPGQPVTYIISLNNGSTTTLTGVRLTDTVPISLTYVPGSFSASTGTGGESGGVVTWTGSVPANGSATVSFGATVDSSLPSCSFITNRALIGGPGYQFERELTGNTPCVCNLTKATGNPVIAKGANGSWDDNDVWRPMVLKEGSSYKLWYVADDGSSPDRIGLATSTNGLNWTKYGGNPVLSPGGGWEAGGLSGGSVISDSGQYKMWFTGFDSSGIGRIGYATSPNGTSWTKYGGNPVLDVGAAGSWEDADVMFPSVLKLGSAYHMWYEGNDGSGQSTHRLGHATSTDGITWTKDGANPVLDVGPPGAWDWLSSYGPNVIYYNDTFVMWYSGQTLPEAWQTGYALSTDGSNWTRQAMLIPEGPTGAFDNASADYAAVIADGNDFKVWYSGHNGTDYTIGYATAQVCSAASSGPFTTVYLPIVLKAWDSRYPCPAYYTDNFSDPGSGWPISDNSDRRYTYIGGQYQIWVKNPYSGWSVTPGAKATDFTASVSARRASGTTGGYGIIFGINEDWSQWYEFDIGVNSYSIWKYDNGYGPALQNWTYSPAVATGTNWNRLKVIRQGSTISVYVNNQLLSTITDGSFTGLRRIGLTAGSGSVSNDVRFDDFSLYPASCGVGAAEVGFEMGAPEIHEAPAPPGGDEAP